jgi:hypothetical protein
MTGILAKLDLYINGVPICQTYIKARVGIHKKDDGERLNLHTYKLNPFVLLCIASYDQLESVSEMPVFASGHG